MLKKKKSNIFKSEKKNLPTSYLRDKNVIYSNILNNIKKQYVIISVKKKKQYVIIGWRPNTEMLRLEERLAKART